MTSPTIMPPRWCVNFVSLVFNHFGESQNIEMDDKCKLDG